MNKEYSCNLNELKSKLEELQAKGIFTTPVEKRFERLQQLKKDYEGCGSNKELKNWERVFKALSSKIRLSILNLIVQGVVCSCEIEYILNISQSTVSHHLKILSEANILSAEKSGKWNIINLEQDEFNKKFLLNILEETL